MKTDWDNFEKTIWKFFRWEYKAKDLYSKSFTVLNNALIIFDYRTEA